MTGIFISSLVPELIVFLAIIDSVLKFALRLGDLMRVRTERQEKRCLAYQSSWEKPTLQGQTFSQTSGIPIGLGLFKPIAKLLGAGLVFWLHVATYGLDLSPGFF